MIFEFVCGNCKQEKESLSNAQFSCECGGIFKRRYSFTVSKPFQPHYNHSVGQYVSNYQQFKDALSKSSDSMSERLGMDTNYQPIDATDKESVKVTDEGMDATREKWREKGIEI